MVKEFLLNPDKHTIDFKKYSKTKNIEGIDFYYEGNLMVFTEWYHLKKGFCCDNNCRHCPYKKNKPS